MENQSGTRDGVDSNLNQSLRNIDDVELPCDTGRLLVTIVEASRLLSLSRSTVYELLYAGSLPSVKIGGARRIRRMDLEEFVRELGAAS